MTQLETELDQLKKEVFEMWNLVSSQIHKSEVALVNFDEDMAFEVVSNEKRVNAFELKIIATVRIFLLFIVRLR